jgi:hypothetical protein
MVGDSGSPLTVLHYLEALRDTAAPFVPGVALVSLFCYRISRIVQA